MPKQEDMAAKPYPWLTDEHSAIDPSILDKEENDLFSSIDNALEEVDNIRGVKRNV